MSDESKLMQIAEDDAIHKLTQAGVTPEAALGLARATLVGAWAEKFMTEWKANEITTSKLNELVVLENWHRVLDNGGGS